MNYGYIMERELNNRQILERIHIIKNLNINAIIVIVQLFKCLNIDNEQ